MAYIAYFLLSRLFFDVLEEGRLVVNAHLVEGIVPKFSVESGLKVSVVLAELVSPRVVYPHVIALLYQLKGQ